VKALKIIVGILSVILTISYGIVLFFVIKHFKMSDRFLYFGIGLVVFAPLWFIIFRKQYFYSTFEHELTHLLVGLLFFKKPAGFNVTEKDGGVVYLYGGNFLITLAPYFLPTITCLLLPVYLLLKPDFYNYYFLIIGYFTSYHIFSTIDEFSYRQPDIIKSGKIFSTIFLIFANIWMYGFLISFVAGGFAEGWIFIKHGVLVIPEIGKNILSLF
jgi:hypothetical protein